VLLRGETLIALGAVPAAVCAPLYFARPLPAPVSGASLGSRAPRFAPETKGVHPATEAVSRTRLLLVGLDGADWDRIDRGIARSSD
jgi:hypothetical protein